jgi:hypothetical protein
MFFVIVFFLLSLSRSFYASTTKRDILLASHYNFVYLRTSIIRNSNTMMPMCFVCLLMIHSIDAKFLLSAESSSIIVLRHIRLPTDHEHYRIRCPYHLNHLTLTLLNYSSGHCFDLHTKSINDACLHHRSPCRYHAKPVQLNCLDRPISSHVDITYQCSSAPVKLSRTAFFEPDR